jgi:hypothetical protein
MKEKFLIFLALFVLIIVLVGLNAASYVQQEKVPDSEIAPNRSTYNVGSTGTRAFYDLLAETGKNVTRWQESPSALLKREINSPRTFVVIGKTQREFEKKEIENLQKWVADGGRLVIIDREPLEELTNTSANWEISVGKGEEPFFNTDPSNQKEMINEVEAAKPIQPTILTKKINAVQPSRYVSSIGITKLSGKDSISTSQNIDSNAPVSNTAQTPTPDEIFENSSDEPPPAPVGKQTGGENSANSATEKSVIIAKDAPNISTSPQIKKIEQISAPVIHLANKDKNLLVEIPFGQGQIVLLSDPYIVSNGGINLVDNAQLGINLLASYDGIIAFDEYHQGYGKNNNLLLAYFEGTPVIAFLLQIVALIGLIFYTKSRRFARPLPADEPNRLSKLEYVAAMAQLQQRTKAYDLAVETIYKDFRRRASKLVGADNFTITRPELAKLIAERIKLSADEIEQIMFKCEDISHGEPTNKKEVINLISHLREIETELGMRRGVKGKK